MLVPKTGSFILSSNLLIFSKKSHSLFSFSYAFMRIIKFYRSYDTGSIPTFKIIYILRK